MLFIGNFKNNIPTQEYIDTITNYNYIDEVGLALPLVYISKYAKQLNDNGIKVGAQCVDLDEDFANRGEVNAQMLKDVGTQFVFLGHKIDKKLSLADYSRLRKKIISVVNAGMVAIVSVGETMEEYETGKTCAVIEKQIKEIFKGISEELSFENFIIAYEPKWAIGTGLCICVDELKSVIRNIKSMIEAYSKKSFRVLFGGSCNVHNIPKYASVDGIDGFAVSRACLEAKQFARILCGDRKNR